MNICEERHLPKYKVIYKGVQGSSYNPVWMVCPNCIEGKTCFGDKKQILSVMAV
jgi:hypothetical protein